MIWVTWRQQRAQILVTAGIVLVLSAILVYIRADVASLLPDLGLVSDKYNQFLNYFAMVMLVLPALLGMFAGAPLFAREIEQGTHIFGLTQSVSRARWVATKLLMAGGPLAVAMFVLGLVAAWALEPLSFVMSGRLVPPLFEIQGVTVGVYALTAFAIGATAGLLLRNTLPAMVVSLIVYAALLIGVANGVRPFYAEATFFSAPLEAMQEGLMEPRDSWTVEYGYVDGNGKEVDFSASECARGPDDFSECMRSRGVTAPYSKAHLSGQFWRFQFTELGLFLVLSAGVLGIGAWSARRKLV